MRIKAILTILFSICALNMGAQTLTATYVQLADSADRYIRQERWADAERVIVKALRHEPANKSNYLLWSNLGLVRTELKDYDGALQAYDIGLASAPKSTMLLSNRARTYLAKGDRKAAMTDLDAALQNDSTLQWPRKMRGLLKVANGDVKGATADFEYYKEKFGDDASVSEAMGDIANMRGDTEGAIEDYKEAYRLSKEADLLEKMLITSLMAGRLDKEEEDLAEGIRKFPRNGTLYLLRAMLNKSRYQTQAMEKDLATAKSLGVDQTLYDQLTASPR